MFTEGSPRRQIEAALVLITFSINVPSAMFASFPAFRFPRAALLPALLVAVALASPAHAQDGGGSETVSGNVAIDALAQAMRGRGWTPVGDLSLADYIGTEVQDSGTRHVKLWIGPDGRAIPKPAWQTYHPTYCKQRARYLQGAVRVLNFKLFPIPPDGYNAFAQFIDVETGIIREQREGGNGIAEAIDAAWGKMNTGVGAPAGPCGEVRLRHVQGGEEVDDVFVFQAGFQGSYGQSLNYTWDFGDGSAPVSGGKRARHTYDAEGTYEVSVRVEGENVEPGASTVSVVVGDEEEEEEESRLPCAVPSDLPFPEEADLRFTAHDMSGGMSCTVAFTFSGDANSVYGNFKRYAINNGYTIEIESNARFSALKGWTLPGLVVEINDMGPTINVGTVTFTTLAN